MRILITTGVYPPESGGPATYSKILEEELPKHGFEVEVLPFRKVRMFPKVVRHLVYFYFVLKMGFKKDIIYAQDPVSVGLPSMIAAFILRKRFFLKVVGDYAWEQGQVRFKVTDRLDLFHEKMKTYTFPVAFLFSIEQIVGGYAEKIIVPSKYLKKIVSRWGIREEKIIVIPNAAPDIRKAGNLSTLRGLINFHGKLVVSVGRLVPWKGFDTVIGTVPALRKQFPDLRLMVIGDGPEMKQLEKKIKRHNLEDAVTLSGRIDHDVALRYIEMADLFVLNTSYEGFSHLLLEAMKVGTPIVTTKVGGNPEIIDDKKNGLLVPFNNKNKLYEAMKSVLQDKGLSQALAGEAERKVGIFTKEKMVSELTQVLQK